MIENINGLVDPSDNEVEFKVSPAVMIRVTKLMAKADAARLIMDQVMAAYKTLADVEQEKMDIEMSAICEAHGHSLPFPYDYALDIEKGTLAIRKKNPFANA